MGEIAATAASSIDACARDADLVALSITSKKRRGLQAVREDKVSKRSSDEQ